MLSYFSVKGFREYIRTAKQILDGNWTGSYTKPSPGLYPHQWNWIFGLPSGKYRISSPAYRTGLVNLHFQPRISSTGFSGPMQDLHTGFHPSSKKRIPVVTSVWIRLTPEFTLLWSVDPDPARRSDFMRRIISMRSWTKRRKISLTAPK